MSLGVHMALTEADVARVLAVEEADALVELIGEELEERYLETGDWSCQTDKAWEAIHRALGDGTLLYEQGPYPLALAVIGGRVLDAGEDYTACLVAPEDVKAVAEALGQVSEAWFSERFASLPDAGYRGRADDADLAYTWGYFEALRRFYGRAAEAGRAVLFTVDA